MLEPVARRAAEVDPKLGEMHEVVLSAGRDLRVAAESA
jgi:hypothetical protein